MMRTLIYVVVIFLMVQLVLGISAGTDYLVESFVDCIDLSVVVEGDLPVDVGEYFFVNCTEVSKDFWDCPCKEGFDLILSTRINTVNFYTIIMTYILEGEEEVTKKVRVGGDGWVDGRSVCGDWGVCLGGVQNRTCRLIGYTSDYFERRKCNITEEVVVVFEEPVLLVNITEEEVFNVSEEEEEEVVEVEVVPPTEPKEKAKSWIWWIIIVLIIGMGLFFIFKKKKDEIGEIET